jgi:hypothetical protein
MDIDPRNGGGVTLAQLVQEHGPLPDTPTALTGGGGTHYYFSLPDGVGKLPHSLGPGIEVLSEDGNTMAPPSIHPSGKQYVWEISSHPDDVPLAPLPDWIVKLSPSRNEAQPLPPGARLPLGKAALDFVANGVPVGQQRLRAVAAARNYLSAGFTVDQTAAALWRGFQVSPVGEEEHPWTFHDAEAIARDIAARPAPPLRSLPAQDHYKRVFLPPIEVPL